MNNQPCVLSFSGPTMCAEFDERFLGALTDEALIALSGFHGSDMVLNAYAPNYLEGPAPHGQLTLCLAAASGTRFAEVGIVFGLLEEDGGPCRRWFDHDRFAQDPENPHACGLRVANFDECWSLMCRLLLGLQPRSVRYSFGFEAGVTSIKPGRSR